LAENASFDVLIDEIRPSVFAVGDDKKKKKREGKERKGKGREGKVHEVTRRYILDIRGADTPRPIPIKCGMRVAPCKKLVTEIGYIDYDQCNQFL